MGTLGWIAITAGGVVVLFIAAILPHNIRIVRARRAFSRLPTGFRDEVLRRIEGAAHASEGGVVLWLPVEGSSDNGTFAGTNPTDVLFHVRLARQSLPAIWRGRWLIARDTPNGTVSVQSDGSPPPQRDRAAIARGLRAIALPIRAIGDDGVERDLLARVDGLEQMLRAHHSDPATLLTQVLHPQVYSRSLEEQDCWMEADTPVLIQAEHDPRCPDCGRAMRFLFQAGTPPGWKGEARVSYVYGCDDHPTRCIGYVDFC